CALRARCAAWHAPSGSCRRGWARGRRPPRTDRRQRRRRRALLTRGATDKVSVMAVRFRQSARMGMYLARQRLARRERFPLLVELEPLFQCNLECTGCGKIQHPEHVLRRRMPVEQAVAAIEECSAPMVSIAGGEPLIHPEIDVIASKLVKRKRFVYLCTNALLLERKLDKFKPSPYFAWAIHIDGMRE